MEPGLAILSLQIKPYAPKNKAFINDYKNRIGASKTWASASDALTGKGEFIYC